MHPISQGKFKVEIRVFASVGIKELFWSFVTDRIKQPELILM